MSAKKVLLSAVAAAGFAVASCAQGMSKTVNLPLGSQNFDSELLGDFVPALTNGFEYAGSDNDSEIVEPGYGNTGRALKVSVGDEPPLLCMISPGDNAAQSVPLPGGLDNKIYIDTKVQFTVTHDGDDADCSEADKLRICLKEVKDVTAPSAAPTTNLYVHAAEFKYVQGQGFVKTPQEVRTNMSDIRPNEWYRLRIEVTRGDPANGTYIPLFKIFIGAADASDADLTLVTSNGVNLYGDSDQVFPSRCGAEADPTLTYVGFSGEGMVDDLAFSKDETVEALYFTCSITNVSETVRFVVNDVTTNEVHVVTPYSAMFPVYPGDVIELLDVTCINGFLPGKPTATGLADLGGNRYRVGDTACSLAVAGVPIPEPTLNGGASAFLSSDNTWSIHAPMYCGIASFVVNGVSVDEAIGQGLYYYKVTSLDDVIEVTAAPFVARVDPPNEYMGMSSTRYLTLNEAVAAAQEDGTVEILTNCTVSAPIVFTNGLYLVNPRYEVSLEADYAFRFANGTNTPVKIVQLHPVVSGSVDERTGTFTWNSGAGSPFLVGSNEAKAGYGISGTYAGSLVLSDCILRAGTASNGNLVKVESGTFRLGGLNGMSSLRSALIGGNRCVKADADAGDFAAIVDIGSGTVSNSTGTAILASANGGTGTAAVTVSGQTYVYGAISCTNTTGTATVAISGGMGGPYFDRDQTAFCPEGYETVYQELIGLWDVRAKSASPVINPSDNVITAKVSAVSAGAAIEAVEVVPPNGGDAVAYKALFNIGAEAAVGEPGSFNVFLESLKTNVVEDVSKEALKVLSSASGSVEVPAGLYYRLTPSTTLPVSGTPVTGLSDGTGVAVEKPTGNTGFIKVEIGTKPYTDSL